ncbi:MAG: hypothetical protein ABI559_11180 [Chloroflexota bacterium]
MKWVVFIGCAFVFVVLVLTLGAVGLSTNSSAGVVVPVSPIDLGSVSGDDVDPSLFIGVFPTPIGVRRSAEQCYAGDSNPCRTAAQAAITDYLANIEPTPLATPSLLYAEYVEWSDNCLGTFHEGQICTQVITPGYRIYLLVRGQIVEKYPEYHADLSGHAKLFMTSDSPPDLPTPP